MSRKKIKRGPVDNGYGTKIHHKHGGVGHPKFKNVYYVKIFLMSQKGMSDSKMSKQLGVSKMAFSNWRQNDPAVRHAIRTGKLSRLDRQKNGVSFSDYVFQRLPAEVQDIWEEICKVGNSRNAGEVIDKIFDNNGGKLTRMHCWIHAYIVNNYNKSAACRSVNISNTTLMNWLKNKKFRELLNQMEEIKKDMVEESLLNLVRIGDPGATIFASRTLNKDRGYDTSQKIQVEHKGKIEHDHDHKVTVNMVNVSDLDLPVELLEQLYDAYQKKAELEGSNGGQLSGGPKLLTSEEEIPDAQFEEIEKEMR